MQAFWNLLSKIKYPALALSTTGAGFGICSLLHNIESKEIQEKNKQIKEWEGKYNFSKRRTKEQREEFIADALKGDGVTKYQLTAVYAKVKNYANCINNAFKENAEKNRAWFGRDYLTQERLNSRCKEPTENS